MVTESVRRTGDGTFCVCVPFVCDTRATGCEDSVSVCFRCFFAARCRFGTPGTRHDSRIAVMRMIQLSTNNLDPKARHCLRLAFQTSQPVLRKEKVGSARVRSWQLVSPRRDWQNHQQRLHDEIEIHGVLWQLGKGDKFPPMGKQPQLFRGCGFSQGTRKSYLRYSRLLCARRSFGALPRISGYLRHRRRSHRHPAISPPFSARITALQAAVSVARLNSPEEEVTHRSRPS